VQWGEEKLKKAFKCFWYGYVLDPGSDGGATIATLMP